RGFKSRLRYQLIARSGVNPERAIFFVPLVPTVDRESWLVHGDIGGRVINCDEESVRDER
ncbi:MAG: hypothetical protein EBX34_04605, partial [Actinobacteria bacterium]|nr:hypothetical protein [Actinomycetota bacterium]